MSRGQGKLSKFKTKQDLVYEDLRGRIIRGEFRPGERLLAGHLAKRLGASAVPIREALLRLRAEGFVSIEPHVGFRVTELSAEEINEIFTIRSVIEGFAARLAAPMMPTAVIRQLENMLNEMDRFVEGGELERFSDLNFRFHRTIYGETPYRLLKEMIHQLHDRTARYRAAVLVAGYPMRAQKEHREILAALEMHDEEAAERLTREHILAAGNELLRVVAAGK